MNTKSQVLGIRYALGKALEQEQDTNEGYSEDYKRGWADALSVLEKQLKAEINRLDPKPIG